MIHKDGRRIDSLEDWRVRAGPKTAIQWKDGRSAKESARAWLEPTPAIPPEIRTLIEDHPDFSTLESWAAEPEARVSFDDLRGEPSNLDVLIVAEDEHGPIVIGVEAKADETFGNTVAGTLAAARKRLADNPRSGGVQRLEQLVQAVLGLELDALDEVIHVRYQLLTAVAATLAEAERRNADRAVLVVHEFVTDETADERHEANAGDFDAFVELLRLQVATSGLRGPCGVHGSPLLRRDIRLYVGKVRRTIRGADAN